MLEVYVSDIENEDYLNNFPAKKSSLLPFRDDFQRVSIKKVRNKESKIEVGYKGLHVLKLNKKEIIEIFEEIVSNNEMFIEIGKKANKGKDIYRIEEIKSELNNLVDNKTYGIVYTDS